MNAIAFVAAGIGLFAVIVSSAILIVAIVADNRAANVPLRSLLTGEPMESAAPARVYSFEMERARRRDAADPGIGGAA